MPLSERDYRWNFFVDSIDFALFSLGMTFGSILTLFPLFAKNLGAGNVEIGLIPAIANLGWGIPAILGAKVSERAQRKLNVVLKFTLGERLPYLFMAFISFFVVPYNPRLALYLSLFMLGIATFSMGFLGPPWMSLIEKVIHPARRGSYFAMGNGLGALMGVGGASLARYFLSNYSFPQNFGYSFLCAGIALLLSFIFLALTREEPDNEIKEDVKFSEYIKGVNLVLKDKNFRNYILLRILGALAGSYTPFIVVFALRKFSIPDKIVADFTGILLVSQGISSFFFGPLGDRLGHKITLIIGRSLSIFSLLLLLLGNSPLFIYIVFILIGLINSSYMVGDLAITLDLAPRDKKELYIGVLNLLIAPFSFLSPLIAGKISDLFGYETLFLISLLIGSFNLIFLIKKVKDPKKG